MFSGISFGDASDPTEFSADDRINLLLYHGDFCESHDSGHSSDIERGNKCYPFKIFTSQPYQILPRDQRTDFYQLGTFLSVRGEVEVGQISSANNRTASQEMYVY
jgi:hypothetical protein